MADQVSANIGQIELLGISKKIGTPAYIIVLMVDDLGDVTWCKGPTKPTDNDNGFATGCLFIDTDDGKVYSNRGDRDNCNFDQVNT